MINKYAAFLIEDTNRIRDSFLRNMPRYQGNNIFYVGFFIKEYCYRWINNAVINSSPKANIPGL